MSEQESWRFACFYLLLCEDEGGKKNAGSISRFWVREIFQRKENNLKESVQEQAQAQKNPIANMHEVSTSASTRKKNISFILCLYLPYSCLSIKCWKHDRNNGSVVVTRQCAIFMISCTYLTCVNPGGGCTPYIRMIGMIVFFRGWNRWFSIF